MSDATEKRDATATGDATDATDASDWALRDDDDEVTDETESSGKRPREEWKATPEEMAAALDDTDRALRRLVKAVRRNENLEKQLERATRQVKVNRVLKKGPAGVHPNRASRMPRASGPKVGDPTRSSD